MLSDKGLTHFVANLFLLVLFFYKPYSDEIVNQRTTVVPNIQKKRPISYDTVFYTTYPLLYHKFGNMVFFRLGNLSSLCSPGNQHYQKIIFFVNFFIKKGRNRRSKFDNQKYISLIIARFINNSNTNTTFVLSISTFSMKKLKMNNFLIILVSWATN